jgi:hypothetical protein
MMPNTATQFLIAPKETGSSEQQKLLHEFANLVEKLPGASVARRHGAGGDLERLTMSAPPKQVDELKARFGHGLIIESDEPLKY